MQRYSMITRDGFSRIEEDSRGQWVEHDGACARISALEAQVKALTEELTTWRDAMEDIACENNEQAESLNKIIDAHGGWDDSVDTYAGHFERIINTLTAERDAQAEAVRVLGHEVRECFVVFARMNKDEMMNHLHPKTDANPIARAAVEKGGGQ